MARVYSLAPLTVADLTPPEVVRVAAEAGYDAASFRLSPFRAGEPQQPMLRTPAGLAPMMKETLARLSASGLSVLDIEVMLLTAERDPRDFAPVFEAGRELGAANALTLIDIADRGLAAEKFARLCETAAGFGIACSLEFAAWLGVGSVQAADAVVTAAAQPNAGVLLDPFHLFRSGGTIADVRALDPARIRYAQFCDAPAVAPATVAQISEEARFQRRFPGEGGLPLAAFLSALPLGTPLGLEVPTRRLAQTLGPVERARRALRAARAVAGDG
jgi:sugar phosphate isomerase/epimerase